MSIQRLFKVLVVSISVLFSSTVATANTTIQHAMGEATFETTPLRVVTLYQGATDAAVALGITPVGVVEAWVEKPTYHYLRDALEGVPLVGLETQPNLEEIARLKPDVIIASKLRHEKIYNQLQMIAPTVAEDTVFEFKDSLNLVAQATGKTAEAEAWFANWDARVREFNSAIAKSKGSDWPEEVALINFRGDHARIYYSSFAGLILNELGFERPDAHKEDVWGVKLTSKEAIPSMNADVFFVFMTDTDPAVVQTYQDWTQHPLWQTLSAVKNNQVFEVNQVDWNMAGGPLAARRMLDSVFVHYGLE